MAKVELINISGIRGIKDCLPLKLNRNSALIFAENGVGKSSIADAIEWYYTDAIDHLRSEEAESTRGRGSLRNLLIPTGKEAFVEIKYSDNKLDSMKSINSSYDTSISNNSKEFKEFISASKSEKLILRYRDLIGFIIAHKTKKLDELQKIIGFSEVAKLRELLGKSARKIGRDIKTANYENRMNSEQATILEHLGQTAFNKEQLFDGANELIKPLRIEKKINSFKDINEILKILESKDNTVLIERISLHTKIGEKINEIVGNIDTINSSYKSYYANYMKLRKDPEKIKKLQILRLLKEGYEILSNDIIQGDYCPLCQQGKSKIELIAELNERIIKLEALEQEIKDLKQQSRELQEILRFNSDAVMALLQEKDIEAEEKSVVDNIKEVKELVDKLSVELKKELVATEIVEPNKIYLDKKKISLFVEKEKALASELFVSKEKDMKLNIHTKLYIIKKTFSEYEEIRRTLEILTKQQLTFEALFTDFVKRQEVALNTFLMMFSDVINECYMTMNPGENVADIKLVPIKDTSDEMIGITMEYTFYDATRTPPKAYLSESHINCLGLAFFLASVKAFNRNNEFLILDDIISSYDKSHRARFIELLTQNFSDYQILVLTHEHEFFELMSSVVKGENWLIRECTWSEGNGVEIEKGALNVQDRILKKFENREIEGLGNDIRIYTERVMKEIASNIEAQVAFKYNELNEKRMISELLDSVHSRISRKGNDLKEKANIPRIKGMPMFIGNTASHDNDFNVTIEDLEVMWEGITKTVQIFYCNDCGTFISIMYFDNVGNNIRCRCGNLTYSWKE